MTNELAPAQDHKDADLPTMEQFLAMVRDYVVQVERAHALLCKHLAVDHPHWLGGGPPHRPQSGRCGPDQEITYFFHGFGCEVKAEGLWVDWDYDAGGRFGGFDTTRLAFFVECCTDRYPELKGKSLLESLFQAALAEGYLHQPYAKSVGNLYYLVPGQPHGRITMNTMAPILEHTAKAITFAVDPVEPTTEAHSREGAYTQFARQQGQPLRAWSHTDASALVRQGYDIHAGSSRAFGLQRTSAFASDARSHLAHHCPGVFASCQ